MYNDVAYRSTSQMVRRRKSKFLCAVAWYVQVRGMIIATSIVFTQNVSLYFSRWVGRQRPDKDGLARPLGLVWEDGLQQTARQGALRLVLVQPRVCNGGAGGETGIRVVQSHHVRAAQLLSLLDTVGRYSRSFAIAMNHDTMGGDMLCLVS